MSRYIAALRLLITFFVCLDEIRLGIRFGGINSIWCDVPIETSQNIPARSHTILIKVFLTSFYYTKLNNIAKQIGLDEWDRPS